MSVPLTIFRSHRVVTPQGVRPAAVHVRGETIERVTEPHEVPPDAHVVDAHDAVVMPGLVDTHVHVNDPGRTHWEGFESATQAAAAGGVTTILDMPLNSVPATTTPAALREKLDAARGRCWVDVGFIGGVVPGNTGELRGLRDAGVLAFKCFLAPSGVDEFTHVTEADLRAALPELAKLGAPLMVHAEHPAHLDAAAPGADGRRYATYLASRPASAEREAVALTIRLAEEHGTRVHIVHVSSADCAPLIREARERGVAITAETCPHYLFFESDAIPDGATEFKCAPPIRDRANRDALWEALARGDIDAVVSDHSPCPPDMKERETGNFLTAWGGIASLQLGLAAVWHGVRERALSLAHIARWMSDAPARLVGLGHRKGRIAPGYDADLVIWNPDARFVVEPEMLQHRHKLTPYTGHQLPGVVEATYVRGQKVFEREGARTDPAGRTLLRGAI